ncbi:DUF4274 domain-containing protein [Subsaximicrobium wynnwilliamsii]|uniref:DUF4274 domain-containing protein n=1 Tax=Subsaximicrobium wynnwilliamsii TaxID=291179 RepID=A0A5C6ZHX3_9FLAO|nr:DUF4274 domain-containing protein [Subsaximicrobium wynnwilliamsii]TXD89728.1 DUF4274 domain-containing protein [Subsaximicrobium wynnwilliamsii]TXE02660.1 DUF4274 domain-containing protein [Subsaximicrobium wynnwilliamsii]
MVLNWIVESPKCDKATASLMVLSADPDLYFDHTAETIQDFEKTVWNLLQKILEKFRENEFKNSN